MHRSEPLEMLSAYLDGEVTPAERDEAERLLEASPELRVDLEDFARLSELIRGLPREAAPSDLAAAVRLQAERQSLLGVGPAVVKRSLRREIVSALIGMAVTAAGMLIMVQTADRGIGRIAQIEDRSGLNRLNSVAATPSMPESNGLLVKADEAFSASSAALQSNAESTRKEMLSGTAPSAPPLAKKSASTIVPMEAAKSEMQLRDAAPSADDKRSARLSETGDRVNWRSVRIGEIVPYFERTGDSVGVVEMTVVDVNQAAGQIEVLLQRYNLPVLQDQERFNEEKRSADGTAVVRKDKQSRAAATGEFVTLYVEAPSGDLAQLLNEMDEQQVFLTAQLQPPVDVPPIQDVAEALEQTDSSPAERSAGVKESAAKEAEQLVKQEAAEATNQYVANKFLANRHLAASGTAASGPEQKPGAANSVRRETSQDLIAGGAGKSESKAVRRGLNQEMDADSPADALAAAQTPPPMSNFRQRSSIAIQNTVNTSQALLANNASSEDKTVPSAVEKSGAKIPAETELLVAKKDRAGEDVPAAEPPPVPTTRLLIVLQQAAPAPVPPPE